MPQKQIKTLADQTEETGLTYFYLEKYKTAIQYYEICAELRSLIKDDKGFANILSACAQANIRLYNYAEAIKQYKQALGTFYKLGKNKRIVNISTILGNIYNNIGACNEALKYHFKVLELIDENTNTKTLALTYSNIGKTYTSLGNYKKALNFHEKALSIRAIFKDDFSIAHSLDEIGYVYQKTGHWDNALNYYQRSLDLKRELGFYNSIPGTLYCIAKILQAKDEHHKAKIIFYDALNQAKNTHNRLIQCKILIELGHTYSKLNSKDKALDYLYDGLEIAKSLKIIEQIKTAYFYLGKIYSSKKKYKKALSCFKQFGKMKDSIFNLKISKQVLEIETKYKTAQKEKENKALIEEKNLQEKTLYNKKIQNYALLGLGFFLLLFISYFIYINHQKNYANERLSKQNIEYETNKQKLEESYLTLQLLSDIGRRITSKLNEDDITKTVFEGISNLIQTDSFGIGIYNHENNSLEFDYILEEGKKLPHLSVPLSQMNTLATQCFAKQLTIHISEYSKEYINYNHDKPSRIVGKLAESIIYLPLTVNKKKKGVISLQAFDKNAYSSYHIYILKNLANYITIAIDNAEAYRRIESQKNQLQQLNNTKDKMFSIIAHDLRSPLGTICNMLETIALDDNNWSEEEISAIIRDLAEASIGSLSLLDNLLFWAKSQRGELAYFPEKCNIGQIAHETLELARISASKKNIRIINETIQKHIVLGDKNMINTVIRNLVSNAIKFTPWGGKIKVKSEPDENNMILVTVSDNGIGIGEKEIKKILNNEMVYPTNGTAKEKGSGLGLMLCNEFVKRNNGTLRIESKLGCGSSFLVSLPISLS